MFNEQQLERTITCKDVERFYKLIGQNDFINLILSDDNEKVIIKKKFQCNETFESIGLYLGLSTNQTFRIYERAIRKIKLQVRKFINFYVNIKSTEVKSKRKKVIGNKIENSKSETTKQQKVYDLILSDILGVNIKWINALNNKGIYTIGNLLQYNRKELLSIPNIGVNTILEIEYLLNHYNLKLRLVY